MTMEITLLGQLTACDVGLSSPRAQVAFALLTLERERGVTRDDLADAVWNRRLPPTWRSALRNVVKSVRDFVAATMPAGNDPLVTANGRYLLHLPEQARVDVEVAAQAAADARVALRAGSAADARRLASEACTLLRTPFLPEHDGEWVTSVRSRLAELLLGSLETASRAALAEGDSAGALAAADEAVALAPLRESAHRCRMAAHAAAGNRSEALRAYQELRRTLAYELGVDPSPETEAAYLDLLGPRLGPRSAGTEPAPFVGRQAELAALSDAWDAATDGARQLAILTGEPGIGKTRLASEAARHVTAHGGLVLFARCDRRSSVPYHPIVELLDGHLASTPRPDLPALNPRQWKALESVFPSLPDAAPLPAPTDRAALLDAVTSVVRHAAADRPVLVVLDDLQWADSETLLLLRQLLDRTRDCRILVMVICRDLPGPGNPLTDVVHAERGSNALHRLRLGLLSTGEVRALVRQLRPAAMNPGSTQHPLLADTSGNPLLLVELLRSPDELGNGTSSGSIPSSVQDLVATTLGTLGRSATQLVRTASITTAVFELDLAGHAAGLDEDAALDALDAALDTGLIVEVDAGRAPPRYRFAHDLMRRAVYDRLSAARRRQLHNRWAAAIEALRADALTSHLPELAEHRLAGAQPNDDHRAVLWARAAASQAAERRAPGEQSRLIRQALAHVPTGDAELRAEMTIELGLAQAKVGDDESEQTLIAGAACASGCDRPDLTAQAALGLADLARSRLHLRDEAVALLHDVLDAPVRTRGAPAVEALLRARLAARLVELAPVEHARGARSVGPATSPLRHRLRNLEGPEHLDERAALAHELATVATAADDREARMVAAHHQAMVAGTIGDDPATRRALDSLAHTIGPDDPHHGTALLAEHAVAAAVIQGRFDQAATMARKIVCPVAASALDLIAWPPPGAMAARQLLLVRCLQGSAGRIDTSDHDPSGDEGADVAGPDRVLTALLAGDRGRARLTAHALATGAESLPGGDVWLHAVGVLALVAVELGDPPLTAKVGELLAPHAELTCGVGYRSFVGPARFHLGRLAVVSGDWAEAESHLTAALSQLAASTARPWIVLAQRALATTLAARGRAYDRAWLRTLRSEAATGAHHLGLDSPPSGRAHPPSDDPATTPNRVSGFCR